MSIPNFATPATKYVSNPIIDEASLPAPFGTQQLYDFQAMIDPANAAQILIFLSALHGTDASGQTIHLYTAPTSNPYAWAHIGETLAASGSGFDAVAVRMGSVIYDGGTFYLFYTGYATNSFADSSVGVATSTDHLSWTRQGQILTGTGQGRNDGPAVSEFAALKTPGGSWTAVYTYRDGTSAPLGFRAATASTPTGTWTKAGSGDLLGDSGAHYWEFHHLVYQAGTYTLIFERGGSVASAIPYECFAASSSDPTMAFTILNSGTALIPRSDPVAAFDQYHTATPGVLTAGNGNPTAISGVYYGYYCGAHDVAEPFYNNKWAPAMVTYAVAPAASGRFASVFAGVVR